MFLRETASEILAADWSSHYAAIKQHGEPLRLVRLLNVAPAVGSGRIGGLAFKSLVALANGTPARA